MTTNKTKAATPVIEAQPPPSKLKKQYALISGILLVACLSIYAQTLNFGFINYDDDQYVFKNPMLKLGLSKEGVAWAFTTFFYANWHPLTWISYLADYEIWGLKASGFHFTNLLFHYANSLLVYFVLKRMTGAAWRSAIVALLFAVHPLRVESVAWISERKDLLCAFFGLLTLGFYERFARSSERPAKWKYYGLVALFLALGLMSKPMLVTLPFAMLLLDFWPLERLRIFSLFSATGGRQLLGLFVEKLPLIVLAAATSILTVLAQRAWGAVMDVVRMPFTYRVTNAAQAYIVYLGKQIWPADLGVLYPLKANLHLWELVSAICLLGFLTVLAVVKARRSPYLATGWFWFLGTLVPVIGLVQVGMQSLADRYTYLPCVGLFVAVVWWISDLTAASKIARKAALAGVAIIVVAFAACAHRQTAYWRDSITLFEHTLEVTTNNIIIENNLGISLVEAGRTAEAVPHFTEALRILPDYEAANLNLADAMLNLNRYPEAIEHYRAALRKRPDNPKALLNLGVLLFQQGDISGAIKCFEDAVHLIPNDAKANNNLGYALASQGRYGEAVPYYTKAVELDPAYDVARTNLEAARKAMNLSK